MRDDKNERPFPLTLSDSGVMLLIEQAQARARVLGFHDETGTLLRRLAEQLLASRSADRTQVEFRTADLPRKEPKIVCDGREVETPSSERATVPAKIMGYAQHFQAHRHHAVAEMAEFILGLTEPVTPASATSAQLLEALRVALGESSSMTLPEVRALLARSEGRDA